MVYAHNTDAERHPLAKQFLESVMNQRDPTGAWQVCLPAQVLMEFLNTITWSRLEAPLPPESSQMHTVVNLLYAVTTRKNIFDTGLVATLKGNGITGIYTVNTKDLKPFTFLDVRNPLQNP